MSGEKKDVLHETAEFVTVDSLMDENRALRQQRDRFKEIAKTTLAALQTGMDLDGFVRGIYEDELAVLQEEFLDV